MIVSPPTAHSSFGRIFLVGFMASGKSTVGRALAAQINYPFYDLDHEIEAAIGGTIGEFIQTQGESKFRQIETQCLQELIGRETAVIAVGGGAFTQETNREIIAQTGISIWLDVPFNICWKRIQSDKTVRPLAPTREAAQARYTVRSPIYALAQYRIQVIDKLEPEAIAREIINRIPQSESPLV